MIYEITNPCHGGIKRVRQFKKRKEENLFQLQARLTMKSTCDKIDWKKFEIDITTETTTASEVKNFQPAKLFS